MSLDDEDLLRQALQLQRKVDRLTGPARAEALAAMELRKVVHYPEKGYKMAKTQQQLLDELDEARIQLRTYRRGLFGAILGVLASLASMICGVLFGHGAGQIVLFVLLGVAGLLTFVIGGGFWCWLCNTEHDRMGYVQGDSPSARLRAAERAYRNSMLEQS